YSYYLLSSLLPLPPSPFPTRRSSDLLDDHWVPVIEKDVDGSNSLPLNLDRENPNLGRYSACRRVSRTIYMGSAPTLRASHRGIEDRKSTRLNSSHLGISYAVFCLKKK